ncbi:Ribosome biogenesis protein BOP1-like protein [Frankliniella fusca]|uniref:Ribosome biogenesis protein BOP1-like protein n=1 Tax=Frankliniella fusca TaxID=407009 RepID=A0AAE1L8W5_9NEOP|nr:Ribosome biogenesis protein BOP1-like protein [Frankliniella fusca]
MSNLLKRVASVVLGDGSEGEPDCKKFCGVQSSDKNLEDTYEPGCNGSCVNDNSVKANVQTETSGSKNDEEDDDLFEALNEPGQRIIHKASAMKVDCIYQLVDIYSLVVEDRLAVVGGFQLGDEDVLYVWMPISLARNYDAKKVLELKSKLEKGKKGYAMFRGMKQTKYGTESYDVVWVQKK